MSQIYFWNRTLLIDILRPGFLSISRSLVLYTQEQI